MRYLLSLIAAAVIAATFWAWRHWPAPTPTAPATDASVSPPSAVAEPSPISPAPEDDLSEAGSAPAAAAVAGSDPGPTLDAALPPPPPAPSGPATPSPSLTEVVWSLRKQSEDWRANDYFSLRARQALDPETLYVAFEYLRSCLGRPLSAAQFETQAARYDRQHRRNPDRFDSEALDNAMEFLQQGIERCDGLDRIELHIAAYQALETSADLGFLPARLEYLRSAARMLLYDDGWLFRHPHYVMRYRDRAEAYGVTVAALDEPEGYLAFAQFLMGGTLGPADPVRAYAFALLAEDADAGGRASAESALRYIGSQLSDAQKKEAKELSDALCERNCRDR